MNDPDATPIVSIRPEPSPEELAAIVAAVTAALRRSTPREEHHEQPASRWARQGRLDAIRGLDREDR